MKGEGGKGHPEEESMPPLVSGTGRFSLIAGLARLRAFVPLSLHPSSFILHPLLFVSLCPLFSLATEQVTFKQGDKQLQVEGRVEVAAQDGGLLLLARDGRLWPIQPKELVQRQALDRPFTPLTADELSKQLLAEVSRDAQATSGGRPFAVHVTAHYVLCYNTSPEYAKWCGGLFEQLYRAFFSYWTHRGAALKEPEFPLSAVIFADRPSYARYAQAEAGPAAQTILGYYSMQTNRMTMCDLTGVEAQARPGVRRSTATEINQVLSRPDAERTVATIVHEATHQIAFNCGLHVRYSDCPLWFSEGIAIFFETPDLASAKGWRNVGSVNRVRLGQFREYVRRRPSEALATLLSDDQRFRDPGQAADAYAEAWALTYFLVRQKPKQYVEYLQTIAAKPPCVDTPKAERLSEFRRIFGDLPKLDAEFLRQMAKVQ